MSQNSSRLIAFTLIEILVVIAIIALLAGLLFPALQGARETAKKSKTQVTISGLSTALKSYYNEYGYWPSTPTPPSNDEELTVADNESLYQMLSGSNLWLDATEGGNPRRIIFLEHKSSDLGTVDAAYLKVTPGGTPNLVNPWGNAYRIVFDYNGDGVATNAGGISVGSFAIWCVGSKNNTYTNVSWK